PGAAAHRGHGGIAGMNWLAGRHGHGPRTPRSGRWRRMLLLLAVVQSTAVAAPQDDYARQWPLTLSQAEAGAYRVVLDEAVYLGAHRRDLGDVEVFNAQGQPVATAVLSPAQPLAQAPRTLQLPWFAL